MDRECFSLEVFAQWPPEISQKGLGGEQVKQINYAKQSNGKRRYVTDCKRLLPKRDDIVYKIQGCFGQNSHMDIESLYIQP